MQERISGMASRCSWHYCFVDLGLRLEGVLLSEEKKFKKFGEGKLWGSRSVGYTFSLSTLLYSSLSTLLYSALRT